MQTGTVVVVTAFGELDAYVADELDAALTEAGDDRRVVADLTAVSFLDSTALGCLVRAARKSKGSGGSLRVLLPETAARRIFEITSLDRALPISTSLEEAVAELESA